MILRNIECKVNGKFHIIIPVINPSYPHDIVPGSANPLRSRLQGGLGRLQDLILAAIGLERKLQSQQGILLLRICYSMYDMYNVYYYITMYDYVHNFLAVFTHWKTSWLLVHSTP